MVRPIDVPQVILQTSAIEKVQQALQQHSSVEQQYLELQFREEKKLAGETVQDTSEAEKAVIKNKENEARKKSPRRKVKMAKIRNDEIEAEKDLDSKGTGRFVDIKV